MLAMNRDDDALEQYRKALSLDPSNSNVKNRIRTIQIHRGHVQDVWAEWHQIIESDPAQFDGWWGYPELTLFLGNEEDYRRTRRGLLKRFGDSTDPLITEKIARACLLLPGSDEELRKATALADRAVAAIPTSDHTLRPYFLFAQGLAEYRAGHFENAIAIMASDASKAIKPAPQLVIAMARYREGDSTAARKTLAAAIQSFDWRVARADRRDIWAIHVLRREAEATIQASPSKSH